MQRFRLNFGLRYSLLAMSALGLWSMPAHAQQRPAETRVRVPMRGQRTRMAFLDPVAAKEAELSARGNPLGEPTTDAQPTADGHGRFRVYRNGFIYWSPETGAHAVYGDIGLKWADMGRERSPLGYPLTDELDDPVRGGGRCNDFQHGMIRWTPEHGTAVLVEQNAGIRVLEPPQLQPPAPQAHDEQATARTILPDGAVEMRYPDGRIERRTDGSVTIIYPDGRTQTRAFVSGQEPSPPLGPADSNELRHWRDYHADSLLNIIKQLTNDEGATNNLLNLERTENLSPYKRINLRARVIARLLGR